MYLAVVLDIFTHAPRTGRAQCRGNLSCSSDQQLSLGVLETALQERVPEIRHSGQGVQCASGAYIYLLKSYQVQIIVATVSKAEENGYAERFMFVQSLACFSTLSIIFYTEFLLFYEKPREEEGRCNALEYVKNHHEAVIFDHPQNVQCILL